MGTIRALIVDHEPLARAHLARLLGSRTGLEIVGVVGSAKEAQAMLNGELPHLVFLDLELADLGRFDHRILTRTEPRPALILTTADSEEAPHQLLVYALDRLLKPFDGRRFNRVLDRCLAYLGLDDAPDLRSQYLRLLSAHPESTFAGTGRHPAVAPRRYADRILVRDGERIFFLRVEDVEKIESAGSSTRILVGGMTYVSPEGIDDLARRLDPRQFLSLRRSTIVNVDRMGRRSDSLASMAS